MLTQVHALRRDSAKARAYADSAAVAFEAELKATPNDAQRHVLLGLALAYAERSAMRSGRAKRGRVRYR